MGGWVGSGEVRSGQPRRHGRANLGGGFAAEVGEEGGEGGREGRGEDGARNILRPRLVWGRCGWPSIRETGEGSGAVRWGRRGTCARGQRIPWEEGKEAIAEMMICLIGCFVATGGPAWVGVGGGGGGGFFQPCWMGRFK